MVVEVDIEEEKTRMRLIAENKRLKNLVRDLKLKTALYTARTEHLNAKLQEVEKYIIPTIVSIPAPTLLFQEYCLAESRYPTKLTRNGIFKRQKVKMEKETLNPLGFESEGEQVVMNENA